MCLSNVANQAEFLNSISNCENDMHLVYSDTDGNIFSEKIIDKGYTKLKSALEIDIQKLAMFDELVRALDDAHGALFNLGHDHMKTLQIHFLLTRAEALQK